MPTPVLDRPDLLEAREEVTDEGLPWNVILHNDAHHAIQDVVHQIQKATGVLVHRAFEITMEAHTHGRAICFTGLLSECERVADTLREIGLIATLELAI
jgi:ATP-dependent Clp protease adaptor protein ClpS